MYHFSSYKKKEQKVVVNAFSSGILQSMSKLIVVKGICNVEFECWAIHEAQVPQLVFCCAHRHNFTLLMSNKCKHRIGYVLSNNGKCQANKKYQLGTLYGWIETR